MKLIVVKFLGRRTITQSVLLVSNLFLGVCWFTWGVTMLAVGVGSAVTILGIPLLALTVRSGRVVGAVERGRLHAIVGTMIEGPATREMPSSVGPWLRAALSDRAGWKGLVFGIAMLPWGVLTFTLVFVLWTVGLGALTSPLYDWALPDGVTDFGAYSFTGWGRIGILSGYVVVGALTIIAIPAVVDFLTQVQVVFTRALLSPGPTELLEKRVDVLQESRSASVASAEAERRRIERDLHDGTQQRLTGIAIDLGMARERLSDLGDENARALVDRAQEGLKDAIAELRDLVRGIHPAILTDRGLDAAIAALASRTSIDVEIRSDLARRLPPEVESAAYFAVSEAINNVVKHSSAASTAVTIRDSGETLVLEIVDDGSGGASIRPSGGLEGLQARLRAVGGSLDVESPVGGPTRVKAVIPCASS